MVPRGATELNLCWRLVGVQERSEQSGLSLVNTATRMPSGVTLQEFVPGVRFDQSVEAKTTQVITHLRGAVVPAEESGHLPTRHDTGVPARESALTARLSPRSAMLPSASGDGVGAPNKAISAQ
jgi:hypothetical protein